MFGGRRVTAEKGDPIAVRHFWWGWMLGLCLYLNIFPLVAILYKLYLLCVKLVLVLVRYFLLLLTTACLKKGKYQIWWQYGERESFVKSCALEWFNIAIRVTELCFISCTHRHEKKFLIHIFMLITVLFLQKCRAVFILYPFQPEILGELILMLKKYFLSFLNIFRYSRISGKFLNTLKTLIKIILGGFFFFC